MKILLYGVIPENNFGGPSLMHGAREIIKTVDPKSEIVFYQWGTPVEVAVKDMEFKVLQIPYVKRTHLLIDAIKLKFGIKPSTEARRVFFDHIKKSEVIASLLGICFCGNFPAKKNGQIKAIKSAIGSFPINFIAKINRIKSVKCTASYGPINSKFHIAMAKFSAKHIFDSMYAREKKSKKELEKVTGKNIPVSPDLANLMPFDKNNKKRTIGISVSHQVIRQWRSQEKYIDCVVELIRHILDSTGYKIILIPNEVQTYDGYHDTHVAEEIHNILNYNSNIEIVDVANITSTQLKNLIAECEVLIASRYHSCVAALSSGVPVLVIGWHYKYDELLQWYGQEKWGISSEDCTSEKLKKLFDEFWIEREANKEMIKSKFPEVREALLKTGREMFSV